VSLIFHSAKSVHVFGAVLSCEMLTNFSSRVLIDLKALRSYNFIYLHNKSAVNFLRRLISKHQQSRYGAWPLWGEAHNKLVCFE